MSERMLLWVTRSGPFNLRTSRSLAGMGLRTATVPVLHIRPTGLLPNAVEPTAIAFTSGHAVRHRPLPEEWRSLPVFTVGEHCAALARECGYPDVRSADGDVSDLRDLILGSVSRFGHVLHLGAREPAGDLVGELRDAGISAELAVVYESIEATPEQLRSVSMGLTFVDGIIVHSAKGARVAAELVRQAQWHGLVFALSAACAQPFERLPGIRVETARTPTERALLDLIGASRMLPPRLRTGAPILPLSGAERPRGNPQLRLVVSNDIRTPDATGNQSPPRPEDDPPPFAA